jgi:hypothetical protein
VRISELHLHSGVFGLNACVAALEISRSVNLCADSQSPDTRNRPSKEALFSSLAFRAGLTLKFI